MEERSISKWSSSQQCWMLLIRKGWKHVRWVERNGHGGYLSESRLLSYFIVYHELTTQGFSATSYQIELLWSATPRVTVCTFIPFTSLLLPNIFLPCGSVSKAVCPEDTDRRSLKRRPSLPSICKLLDICTVSVYAFHMCSLVLTCSILLWDTP